MQTDTPPLWDDLRVLLELHRRGSFLAAAKALGVATSTVARRIDGLAEALDRPLVRRSTSGTVLAPDALELVALAEQMELGLAAVRRDAGSRSLTGTVRISLPEGAVRPVMERLAELRRLHPALLLEVLSEARVVDLARREADIGLRATAAASPSVIARPLGRATFGLYAAPSYVERRLRTPRIAVVDFPRHDFLGYDGALAKGTQGRWLTAHGAKRFVLRSSSDHVVLDAAFFGQGIALLSDAAGRATPGLVRLEVDAPLPSMPVYVAYHRDLRRVPRVRAVVQAISVGLRDSLR